MKRRGLALLAACVVIGLLVGCAAPGTMSEFGDDVSFLEKHLDPIVLKDESGEGRVAVVPGYQGRVMTSTSSGESGMSYGWINYDLIASGERKPHMNAFGGEDRFWLGPEGGQYSLYFDKGTPFDLEHWQVPSVIDWDPWPVVSQSPDSATFEMSMDLTNYSGTPLDIKAERTIRMLSEQDFSDIFGVDPSSDVEAVCYESENTITNTGKEAWKKETGLVSIWILGMYNASPETTVAIPYKNGDAAPEKVVNDEYFGKVPSDRLVVEDETVFFSADGNYRSKIGIGPNYAEPVLGSYDAANNVLTLVHYKLPENAEDLPYVNSLWKQQEHPYKGDVVNSYNDGPPAPGKEQMGKFYEVESSSPAAQLEPGESLTHVHQTFHLHGPRAELDRIAKATLGVGLAQIERALE